MEMRHFLRRVRGSRAVFVVAVLVVVGTAMVGTTGATAGTDVTTDIGFPFTGPNPCTGEELLGSGRIHLLVGGTTSTGGTSQSHAAANLQGIKAVGVVSGATYVAVDTSSQTFVIDDDAMPFHFKYEETAQLIRQGELVPTDDFYLHVLTHITVNATGTATVDDTTTDMRCR